MVSKEYEIEMICDWK